MSNEIDLAQIKRAAHNAVPLTFKTYTLPHETEIYLDTGARELPRRARTGETEGAAFVLPPRAGRECEKGEHEARLLPGERPRSQQRQGIRDRDEEFQTGDIRQHPVLSAEAERAGHVHQGHLPDERPVAQHHGAEQRRDLAQGADEGIRPARPIARFQLSRGGLCHGAGQHGGGGAGHRDPRAHDEEDRPQRGLFRHRQRRG